MGIRWSLAFERAWSLGSESRQSSLADYRTWPEKQPAVTSLQLDPQNPRIPSQDADFEQPELIAELVEHDNVYELAKDIADTGYNPLELLLGVEEEGKTYIVE